MKSHAQRVERETKTLAAEVLNHIALLKLYVRMDSDATHHELRYGIKDAIPMLERLAELLERVEHGELATVKHAGRAKFKPCCDGTDYRCSICGGIVRYDGTPPEGE